MQKEGKRGWPTETDDHGDCQGRRVKHQVPPEYKPTGVNESTGGIKVLGNKHISFSLLTPLLTSFPRVASTPYTTGVRSIHVA